MANDHSHGSSVATYVIVALILGVITYIEFAIVEYEIAWLSTFWILFWLVLLSIAKFVLVVMFFMHLKDDDNLYTGFFGSGMVFALGTFVVLALLFTLPATFRFFQAETPAVEPEHVEETTHAEDAGHGAEVALSEELRSRIETDGYSRPIAQILDLPRPKDHRLVLRAPGVPEEVGYTLSAEPALFGQAAGGTAQEEAASAEQDRAEGAEGPADAQDGSGQDEAAQEAGADADQQTPDEAAQQEEPPADEAVEGGAPASGWDQELGEQVYSGNCAACHQANGTGIPGAFPPLAENMPRLYAAGGGREYLIDVMLYGLQGQITVSGMTYNGVMPAWQQLSNEQIAAVLNHELTSWGNNDLIDDFSPIAPDEVEAQRGQGLSAQQVREERGALVLP